MRVCDLPQQYIERGLQFHGSGAGDIRQVIMVEQTFGWVAQQEVFITAILLPIQAGSHVSYHYWTECQAPVVLDSLRAMFESGIL